LSLHRVYCPGSLAGTAELDKLLYLFSDSIMYLPDHKINGSYSSTM